MKILLIHLGDLSDCFIASSLNRAIFNYYGKYSDITWVVKNAETEKIFKYNKKVNCYTLSDFVTSLPQTYDVLINLDYNFNGFNDDLLHADTKYGCKYKNDITEYRQAIEYGVSIDKSLFEIYYDLANFSWRGEGYDFKYYPKNKTKERRLGISIINNKLNEYLDNHFVVPFMKKWNVPYKKNLFKKLDEINRCSRIVTDDFLTLQLALYLRKYVYFLKYIDYNLKIELFNNGQIINVPQNIVR